MAKKPKKKPKDKGGSGSGESKKTPDLSPKEAGQIIEQEAQEETARILAELNLQLINSGNTLDKKSLKEILKTKYGTDLAKDEKLKLSELNYPVEEVISIEVNGN
ncbi:MAG: hypothetical protein F6K54_16210 [Okeania sp. SIO3B5]|uniref:hypothetical protein n=1 Tax=Okeania sp. SIO3B5 TaxID=2607811 RepID=UPI0013FF786D|nr:hypothetical protein [Okeania sp. SIO3B5]NEO54488.1 hypothetical protein [Okeania sp. SIO3B5]